MKTMIVRMFVLALSLMSVSAFAQVDYVKEYMDCGTADVSIDHANYINGLPGMILHVSDADFVAKLRAERVGTYQLGHSSLGVSAFGRTTTRDSIADGTYSSFGGGGGTIIPGERAIRRFKYQFTINNAQRVLDVKVFRMDETPGSQRLIAAKVFRHCSL